MRTFNLSEIKQCIQLDGEAIDVVEEAFSKLAAGQVEMPPIVRIDFPDYAGEVDIKTAHIHGLDSFAIKISSGFFNNDKLGLPSGNGMMLLFSTITGVPEAVLLDNGYLTDVRTAAAGAVAAKHLARTKIERAGVIGAGTQARYQMLALQHVRRFQRLIVYAPGAEQVQQYVHEMERLLDVEIIPAKSVEEVVKESDIVVTTTPARMPLVRAEWLHPGLHITAMGSDAEHKQELESDVLQRADVYVCVVKSQCIKLGELRHVWHDWEQKQPNRPIEIGELTSGVKAGRTNDQQITICDLTGTGVQDTAIARLAFNKLTANNAGIRVD